MVIRLCSNQQSESSREDDVVNREMEQLRVENIRLKHDVKKLSQKVEKAKNDREEQRRYDERTYRDVCTCDI
jgi:uncharacterized protein YlxW (UPF0749 family)